MIKTASFHFGAAQYVIVPDHVVGLQAFGDTTKIFLNGGHVISVTSPMPQVVRTLKEVSV